MKLQLVNSFRVARAALVVAAAGFIAPVALDKLVESAGFESALVASAVAQGSKQEKRALPGISEPFYKKLGKVADYASPPEDSDRKPDFKAALAELKKLEKDCEKCNAYELAQVYNYYGWIYYMLEDIDKSILYYDKVVQQSPMIPWGLELSTIFTLAQLEFSQERYDAALKRLNRWMSLSDTVGADVYYLKSQICYQTEDKKCSLDNILTAIKMVEDKGQIAKEPWYGLQKALYLEKEDYRSTLPILEKLVRHYPKKSYWQQLSSVYGLLEQDKKQLGALDATYVMGGLDKEQQILNLVYLLIQNEYPYRAASVLDKAIDDKIAKRNEKNLETLAKAWSQAKEKRKAIPVMTEAADLSDTGDTWGLVMALYLDVDDSKNAVKAGEKALKKGKLERPGDIHLNIGIAHVDLHEYEAAIKSFRKAEEDKRVKRIAENWRKYAQSELDRKRQLAQN